METQVAVLDSLLNSLRKLRGNSNQQLDDLAKLLKIAEDLPLPTQREAERGQKLRIELWRRLLQDIPLDERSFNDRFGADSRSDIITRLNTWCLNYVEQTPRRQARYSKLFGFLGLFLLTLLSLSESEAQRSVPFVASPQKSGGGALTHNCSETCVRLVENSVIAESIYDVYAPEARQNNSRTEYYRGLAVREWETLSVSSMRFHRHGTTSVILRGETKGAVHGTRPEFALKLILYPFKRIPTIVKATREYAARYDAAISDARHLVHVWASSDSWILMDFISGKTLAEVLQEELNREVAPAKRKRHAQKERDPNHSTDLHLDRLERYGNLLFQALEELERLSTLGQGSMRYFSDGVHGDLSPSNIIVTETDKSFQLIDLGRNYLYIHSITGVTGLDAVYIAPEVKAGANSIGRADIYSLGQLLILFGSGRPSVDGPVPDVFYARAPLLARFVEDLIDADPERRLLVFSAPPDTKSLYAHLRQVFLEELEAVRAAEAEGVVLRAVTGWQLARELLRPLAGAPGRQWRLWKKRKEQESYRIPQRRRLTWWLFLWSYIAAVLWAVTMLTILVWLSRDLNLDWGNNVIDAIQRISHTPNGLPIVDSWRASDYKLPDWRNNLPARIVTLSYAMIGAKYYEALFSGVSPLVVGRRAGKLTRSALQAEFGMRAMAVMAPALIMPVALIEPRWWSIELPIGQAFTWFANYSTIAFLRTAISEARRVGLTTVAEDDSKITGLHSFRQWAPTSLFYAIVVSAVGTAIYVHALHDIYMYALGAASINIFLFYIIKCGVGGPSVRIAISRGCFTAERLSKIGSIK